MNLKFAAVSVVALALFIGPVMAQDPPPADQPAAAEQPAAEQPAEAAAPAAIPDAVMALVNDRRSSQELSDGELKKRAQQARRAMRTPGLPDDIKGQLQAMMDADRAELETRVAAQKPAEKPVEEAAPAPKVEEPVQQAEPEVAPVEKKIKPKVEEPVQQAEPEAAPAPAPVAEIPADVTELLNDTRTLEELTDKQLADRARSARAQSRNAALPEDVRQKLAGISKEARQAMVARQQQAEEKKKTDEPIVAQPAPAPAPAPKAEEPVVAQPEQPAPKKDEPVVAQPEPAPVVTEPPPETKAAEPAVQPVPPPVVDKADVKELDGNAGDPAAEKKARAYLDDATPADSLTDEALRARLDGIRDLMAENELSIKTERALRQKLGTERDVLRARVANVKAEEDAKAAAAKAAEDKKKAEADAAAGKQPEPKKDRKPNITIIITADTSIEDILRDRRDLSDMDESEIRYRIRARREFEASERFREYDEEQRQQWREVNRRDRDYLRQQLEEDRNIRRVELDRPSNIRRIVIDDSQRYEDEYPDEVFAAEVDDTELERVLLAPPRKKITRKISVNDLARQPEARKAMTRIDVDTIRFGFNEAFVREEEVDSLDKIASVMEQVLKKYPREVFLIEGHTDAVGSDAYNDKLSKARAEAVKKALSTYYVIPPKNLQTVGLGERYLKIPTAEAEQENRRVSISRATAVIGEAAE